MNAIFYDMVLVQPCDVRQGVNRVEVIELSVLRSIYPVVDGFVQKVIPSNSFSAPLYVFLGIPCFLPYARLLFKMCNAYIEFGLSVLKYLICSRYLIFREPSV